MGSVGAVWLYQPVPPPVAEVAIKPRIDELYTAQPCYGSRTLTALLTPAFGPITRTRVQRSRRAMGIAGSAPRPNLSQRLIAHRVYPQLVPTITAQRPNHLWGGAITQIRLRHGGLYRVAIRDGCRRYGVRWTRDETLDMGVVLAAIAPASASAPPAMWNTEQGSHVTSPQGTEPRAAAGGQSSMDGTGRAPENSFTERLWRSVTYAAGYRAEYGNPRDARHGLGRYCSFYTTERPPPALDDRRPADRYLASRMSIPALTGCA